MNHLLAKTLLGGLFLSFGVFAYECNNSSSPSSEDAGVGSSSGVASGSSSGVSSSSGSSSGAIVDGGADAETFTDLYATVLGPNGPYGCSSHHAAGQANSFLDLGDGQSTAYASLAPNVHPAGPACGDGGTTLLRVQPGSPASSLLWLKVWTLADGGNEVPCGVQMPKNVDGGEVSGHPLSPADEAKVKSWIAAGAHNN